MDAANIPSPTQEASDIFSLSDQVLSDRLQFIEEIGFGNWGSVWLCKPKPDSSVPADGLVPETKLAVKLVHRSKTTTTAARVKSLWNEMKIVRTFKSDPHPSIIPFHSFIITPSYALITMTYLPTLVPVEVEELKAREWFRFLLSGVEFLHKRGVVHNDIKPANILLSNKNIPVLVDFGFAEKYDLDSDTAFHSNLSYGTPEYLSPERARGLPHDTRKSDVWSLGVTFFEILTGRTPFENSDGEQFNTKEDLEKYWERTLRGKWVGTWTMSSGMERLLHRMIAPNADLRCTATQAMADAYWGPRKDALAAHRRSTSYTSSVVFEKDMAKLLNMTPTSRKGKENLATPPGLDVLRDASSSSIPRPALSKSRSQTKVATSKIQPRKRVPAPPIMDLSPIKASPPTSPLTSASAKENIASFNALASSTKSRGGRQPLGAVSGRENLPKQQRLAGKPSVDDVAKNKHRNSRVFGDTRNTNTPSGKGKDSTNVKDRVREWEREKQRLREMERLEELERDRDEQIERGDEGEQETEQEHEQEDQEREERQEKEAIQEKKKRRNAHRSSVQDLEWDKENVNAYMRTGSTSPVLPLPQLTSPLTKAVLRAIPSDTPRTTKDSSRNIFKHSIKKSIDRTMQMYSQVTARSVRSLSIDIRNEAASPATSSPKDPWQDEPMFREVNASLPVVKNAAQRDQIAADAHSDRLTIWMRNVDKVVEDAKQNFASSSVARDVPLPSLPIPPLSRNTSQKNSNRSSRLPRKILAASQIFTEENVQSIGADQSMMSNTTSMYANANNTSTVNNLTDEEGPSEGRSQLLVPEIHTPSRQRRATVSTGSPEATPSPSKRRRSHGNLFQQRIARLSLIEAELNKPTLQTPLASPRLSQVLDRSLFIASPLMSCERLDDSQSIIITRTASFDDLTSSPCHVEPYPARKLNPDAPLPPDTPSQRRLEGVYDRFLMATSGVKRLGKGYQSDNVGPISNSASLGVSNNPKYGSHRAFYTARRPMPPPVSSEDQRRTVSVDELGVMTISSGPSDSPMLKDESNNTVALVRRAIKAMVPGKTAVSRRLSRMA
ncbi:hypothetical protein BDQ12DRAFT_648195 [Crucibulum laeve]|uniref:Protein kinase domain-containing protein n=1 Tax=Crucibulum laeve TaxID=68775 RepID=A0A5C3M856_9AGAR|nr:hypothetical protein BDQ12DRAFT_648195 [Crucibulum laeve]